MSNDEAITVGTTIKGLFPSVTHEQLRLLQRDFESLPFPAVIAAVERLARRTESFSIPRLREMVGEQLPRGNAPEVDHRKRTEDLWKQIDARLDSLSDDQLNKAKLAALKGMPAASRRILERSDPKSSRTLRALMIEHA